MPRLPVDSQITFLTVDDLDSSDAFYGKLLGLDLVLDQGPCRIYRVTATSYLGICTHREDTRAEGVIITIVTDRVDEWYQELMEAGASFDSEPALNEKFNIYHVFLRDPDGHLVEIQQFQDPQWAGPRTTEDLLTEARGRVGRWSPAVALAKQQAGAVVIDVRDSGDRSREGAIPGAIAIPLSVLEWRADPTSPFRMEGLAGTEDTLILVCNDGYSSSLAAARLKELGRQSVGDVAGGFRAWKLEGLPVE